MCFSVLPCLRILYTFFRLTRPFSPVVGASLERAISMPKPEEIALQSNLAVEECVRRIEQSADIGQRTIFSLSGYKGSKPLLVKFNGNQFRLWKRRYYRNDFAPYFFGTFSPDSQGARLVGHFAMDHWVKIFIRIWLAFAIVLSLPVLIATLSRTNQGSAWVGVLVPLGLVLFGIFLPKFGRWMGKGEEKFIREYLQNTLSAQPIESQFTVSQRVVENTPL